MFRNVVHFLIAALTLLSAPSAIAESDIRVEGLIFYSGQREFRAMPMFVRDFFASEYREPIKQDRVLLSLWAFGARGGGVYSWKQFEFSLGPALYLSYQGGGPSAKNRAQQNQEGTSQRGDPFDLYYYEVHPHLGQGHLRVFTFVKLPPFRIRDGQGLRISGGYEYDPRGAPLVVEMGWDAYNKDHLQEEVGFGRLREDAVLFRLDYERLGPAFEWKGSLFVEVGWTRSVFEPYPQFRSVKFRNDPVIRLSFGYGGSW